MTLKFTSTLDKCQAPDAHAGEMQTVVNELRVWIIGALLREPREVIDYGLRVFKFVELNL